MELRILEMAEKSIRLILSNSYVAFANALRRIAISEVPCMTIDDVFIYENSSILSDEVIAHRLGLIPLKTDLDTYILPEKCECKSEMGCNRCRVIVTLEAEAGDSVLTVYSKDLKFEDPDVYPVSGGIPIIKLAVGQRLKLEAHAKLGLGKKHAKWQPVSTCAYKYMPILNVNQKTCDTCSICVEACPKRILQLEGGKLTFRDVMSCTLCNECVKVCPKKPSAIEVKHDDTTFIFNIDSTGCLPAQRILLECMEILKNKADELNRQIKGIGEIEA